MKNWYKQPFTKIILSVIAIVAPAIAAVCLMLMVGIAETMSPEAAFGAGEAFEESDFFEELMHSVSVQMLDIYSQKELLETDGKYDPDKLVDVMEYVKSGDITDENISGLAYTVGELAEWGRKSDIYGDTDRVIVCQKSDDTYRYYWIEDFKKLLSDGRLVPEGDGEDLEMFLEELEEGYLFQESRNIVLKDEEGNVYTDIWTYDGSILKEYYAPDGAKDILELVNKTPELNGRLMQVYDNIEETMNSISNIDNMYQEQSDMWEEGNTNFTYLFVNREKKKIYTNNSLFKDFESIENDLDMFINDGDIRYVLVRPRLNEFESNLDVTASDWRNYVNGGDILGEDYIVMSAVDVSYPIQDIFYEAQKNYSEYEPYMGGAFRALLISAILFIVSIVWLTAVAGRRADGGDELYLNPFDRWKTELSAALVAVPWLFITMSLAWNWNGVGIQAYSYGEDTIYSSHYLYYYGFNMTGEDACIIAVYAAVTAALFLIGYLSLVRRIKGRTLWKDSVLKMLLTWIVKCCQFVSHHVQVFWRHRRVLWKTILVFAVVVFNHWFAVAIYGTPVFGAFLMAVSEAIAAYLLIRDAVAKERIKNGIQEIASGNLDYKLPLNSRQGGDYQDMAENLNNIGNGLQMAVDKSIRDERLKTDLITNVSHDIKTPLTSIINYVDLLKRENFEDPKIQGYLDVLEMKAQRLKTLTEDVVEASKVSSGNITLEYMDVDLVEMLNQTIGEFSEKMEAKQLKVIASLPEEPAVIHVDGRRMWRVLENIFNNAAKYAMPGTRVYADLKAEGKKISFSLKNVSEQPLNFSSDELTERFIRGDVSRSTEGSGLGLSIAKSLTEMQGGKFELYLDGDLFKVTIEFE